MVVVTVKLSELIHRAKTGQIPNAIRGNALQRMKYRGNPERVNAKSRTWYRLHREARIRAIMEYQKNMPQDKKERKRDYHRRYYQEHREEILKKKREKRMMVRIND